MSRRTAWQLIGAGLLAMAIGIPGSMVLPDGWHVLLITATVLAGLAFFIGVAGLASQKWILVPAFIAAAFGPIILAVIGHDALLGTYGTPEQCTLRTTEEHRTTKHPSVDHVLDCPSGEQEITTAWSERLRAQQATVLTLPPFRPMLAETTSFSLGLLAAIPVAMAALVITAGAVRKES
ncbi:hypothetical protein FKR81_29120 [Lentzea tibetensis]|uniref:Uncharacterized protein n=1 Tax=Lentzea tibetensis TaxID=2591470 RepID=A0A563EMD8_9PSEU|nr:hypothetical protein [Lentzea tibetensis]TWP48351.1 hypothetical protein FKR81_29120 [Lentzea tibetensis]